MNILKDIEKLIYNSNNNILIDELLLYRIIDNIEKYGDVFNNEPLKMLNTYANSIREKYYGNKVYVRGLIEFTNYCKNNCYYCGINRNIKTNRYRLTKEQILTCCENGYNLGFRTFVLQGGEDAFFTQEKIVDIVKEIRNSYPDCAITLSIGERTKEDYEAFYLAGANRFLLRHETATKEHYYNLHPQEMDFDNRVNCLYNLKKIGFATGAGFMVGSPNQTTQNLVNDLLFLDKLKPHMVGIGPFIPHNKTKFKDFKAGTIVMTLCMVSLARIIVPTALLPATTALSSISKDGKSLGVLAGCNVIMINLSPDDTKSAYLLYDNKACLNENASNVIKLSKEEFSKIGYELDFSRGDYNGFVL